MQGPITQHHSAETIDTKGSRSRFGRLFGRSKKNSAPLSKQGSPTKFRKSKGRTRSGSSKNSFISDQSTSKQNSELQLSLSSTESSDRENSSNEVCTMPETPGSLTDVFAKEALPLTPLTNHSELYQSRPRTKKEFKHKSQKKDKKKQENGIISIDHDRESSAPSVFFSTNNNPFRCGSIHNTLDNVCRTSPNAFSKTKEEAKESTSNDNQAIIQQLRRKSHDNPATKNLLSTRAALARPFGRTSLPAHLAKNWLVQITPELSKERTWQYQILVQKEEYGLPQTTISSTKSPTSSLQSDTHFNVPELSWSSSLPATQVTRSLMDFVWLEQALNTELGGSALIPDLGLAIYSKNDWTTADTLNKEGFERGEWDPLLLAHSYLEDLLDRENRSDGGLIVQLQDGQEDLGAVNENLLSDWLSDVLNLVRGKGELLLSYMDSNDHNAASGSFILHSEAMEMFLYRTYESLPKPARRNIQGGPLSPKEKDSTPWIDMISSPIEMMNTHLSCLSSLDVCDLGGNTKSGDDLDSISNLSYSVQHSDAILSRRHKIHSQRSKKGNKPRFLRSEVINAQQLVVSYQREHTLRAMYRLRILLEKEALLSAGWKRYAISLSNLFGFEKDVQFSKVSSPSKKVNTEHSKGDRKLSKVSIDDSLRILAKQKVDRAIPSLNVLSGMLNAYFTDLSAVDPSLQAYSDAVEQLGYEPSNINSSKGDSPSWKFQMKTLSPMSLLSTSSSHDSDSLNGNSSCSDVLERRALEEQFSIHEDVLQSSLLQLCNSSHIRVARMGWKFFKMEAGQANLLNSAAVKLQSKVEEECKSSVQSPSSGNRSEESEDNIKEIEIVRRLLQLGSTRKYKFQPLQKSSSISGSHTGSENSGYSGYESNSIEDESQHTGMDGDVTTSPGFERILMLVNDRAGLWDAELAMAIMEAAGIDDADVLVEETSRDLRAVRKLSVGLRENVNRCREALAVIRDVALGDSAQVRIYVICNCINRVELTHWQTFFNRYHKIVIMTKPISQNFLELENVF